MASDSPGIPESVIAQIWQRQLVKKKALVTSDGQLVEVIYPGRANRSGGPDFRGAIIAIRDEFLRGDVEVHLRSSGWQAHGHDRNPAFSGVILHVVMWDDTPCSRRPREGKPIPILPLYRCLQAPLEKILWKVAQPPVSNDPCAGVRHRLGGESLERVLDDLGEARFRDKVARFRDGLSIGEAGQVLYEGLMEALGYSKNKEAFRELAQRLPLRAMEGLVRDQGPEARDLILQALLLGTAGFLRTSRHGPGAAPLRKAWSSLGGGACMAETSWHFTAVRPGNHPTRRLEAARALILRFLDGGAYRPFNLVIADNRDAYWLKSTGAGAIEAATLGTGISMLTARDLNDTSSGRIAAFMPRFKKATAPVSAAGDWTEWEALMAAGTPKPGDDPHTAMALAPIKGYGTISGSLLALPSSDLTALPGSDGHGKPRWRFCAGRPGTAPYCDVTI